jgi:hypothetical protein
VDGSEGRIVRCAIGRCQADARNQCIRIFSVARRAGGEGYSGELHARWRRLTQPGEHGRGVEPRRADLFERCVGSTANREIGPLKQAEARIMVETLEGA